MANRRLRSEARRMKRIADEVFRPSILFRYFRGAFRCRVQGCRAFTRNPLCKKHQHSPKFQYLSQR